jgi:hypothetical protein
MLDGDDPATRTAVRELEDTLSKSRKPLVFWLGAGTSAWAGLPTWNELASRALNAFKAYEAGLDQTAQEFFARGNYPGLFQVLRDRNAQRLNALLVESLSLPSSSPVFERFIAKLRTRRPLKVVTTNFDDALQAALASPLVIHRTDIEGAVSALLDDREFVLKIHGTLGSINTCIVTEKDYLELVGDSGYLQFVQQLFAQTHVVFLGTSLSDEYVLERLQATSDLKQLFGDGPHFLVGQSRAALPKSIRQLRISKAEFSDYRSSIRVLDLIQDAVQDLPPVDTSEPSITPEPVDQRSAYFIADFLPAGTWNTSQTIQASSADGEKKQVTIGMGFVNEETPGLRSTSFHDLVVGLICFDIVVTPLSSIGRLHLMLGAENFARLIDAEAIRFLWLTDEPAVTFKDEGEAGGRLDLIRLMGGEAKDLLLPEALRRQLNPSPGREEAFERFLQKIELLCDSVSHDDVKVARSIVNDATLSKQLRRSLGFSDAIQITNIPKWNVFPMLRLAHVTLTGVICNRFRINGAKLLFGTEVLANATYGLIAEKETASEVASYVVAGKLSADVGHSFEADPSLFKYLLMFRESPEAQSLRREIKEILATESGSEFIAALNGGLKRLASSLALERARHAFSLLSPRVVAMDQKASVVHLWQDPMRGAQWMTLWRKRSAAQFLRELTRLGRAPTDQCPCHSGEVVKHCCGAALSM